MLAGTNNTTKVATVSIILIAAVAGLNINFFIMIILNEYTYFYLIAQHCVQ
jgi:hypothetical protein